MGVKSFFFRPGKFGAILKNSGLDWRPFPLSRRGLNPVSRPSAFTINNLYRQIKPDITHHFTTKCYYLWLFRSKMAGFLT